MMLENENLSQKLSGYVLRSREYLDNAYVLLDQGEAEKGGECLWGSMAQAMKAVAAFKEVELRSHRDIWNYARSLSSELGDENLLNAFRDANYLHSGFYESGLTVEMVLEYGESIREAIGKLLTMIPPEALDQ